jgi:hypothetical protein
VAFANNRDPYPKLRYDIFSAIIPGNSARKAPPSRAKQHLRDLTSQTLQPKIGPRCGLSACRHIQQGSNLSEVPPNASICMDYTRQSHARDFDFTTLFRHLTNAFAH